MPCLILLIETGDHSALFDDCMGPVVPARLNIDRRPPACNIACLDHENNELLQQY